MLQPDPVRYCKTCGRAWPRQPWRYLFHACNGQQFHFVIVLALYAATVVLVVAHYAVGVPITYGYVSMTLGVLAFFALKPRLARSRP